MKKLLLFLGVAALAWSCNNDDNNAPAVKYAVFDFENAPVVAGPTAAGENLYSEDNSMTPYGPGLEGYDSEFPNFTSYTDAATGLTICLNVDEGTEAWNTNKPEFYAGGIAPSRWNNMVAAGFSNACSVYYKAANGNGGHGGSKTFGVVYSPATMSFANGVEKQIESIWVTNSTYVVQEIDNSGLEDAEGWFMLTLEGFSSDGTSTGTVDLYLADFRPESATKGVITTWTQLSLNKLGKVNSIKSSFTGSDVGQWGLNTPSYVCIDDVKVVID